MRATPNQPHRHIRAGAKGSGSSLKDGKVTVFIPGHETESPDGAMGEGIALDAAGNLYTAEATVRGVTKYVKN